jgi:hypothetical protein
MIWMVAIDPGASGGIASMTVNGSVSAVKMPETEGDVLSLLRNLKTYHDTIFIEQVGGYIGGRGSPGSAMFNFGRGFGFLLGVAMCLNYRIEMVRPQTWQKALSLGNSKSMASKTEWKNKLKAEAQRRFPELSVTLSTADALLILEYGTHHTLRMAKGGGGSVITKSSDK